MATFGKLLRPHREFLDHLAANMGERPLTPAQVEEAQGYDFGKVTAPLDRLRAALEKAIEADKAEATSFWTEFSESVQKGLLYIPAYLQFRDEANALIAKAWAALMAVEGLVWRDLGQYATVPDQLDADARQWTLNSFRAREVEKACANQADVPGWAGDAKNEYVLAAIVQKNAMFELAGVMKSSAQGCSAGALLNRAIFLVVSEAITGAVMKIEGAQGRGTNRSKDRFGRTATALSELEYLAEKIGKAVRGDVAEGSARNLAAELDNTVQMPNLLAPGTWPTGTQGAGVEPVDTASGVTSDGSDANTRVVPGRRNHHEGIDR